MKKYYYIIIIAAALVACSSHGNKKETGNGDGDSVSSNYDGAQGTSSDLNYSDFRGYHSTACSNDSRYYNDEENDEDEDDGYDFDDDHDDDNEDISPRYYRVSRSGGSITVRDLDGNYAHYDVDRYGNVSGYDNNGNYYHVS